MILNIVVGIVLAAIVIALGGALLHGGAWGGPRGMNGYGKERPMMDSTQTGDADTGAMMEVNVQ